MSQLLTALQRQLSLGNLVRALQLAAEAYDQSAVETRYHLRELAGWIGANLRVDHEPASLPDRVELPQPIVERLNSAMVSRQGPSPTVPVGAGEALTLLVDSVCDEAFIGRLMLDVSTQQQNRAAGPPVRGTFSFTDALDAAVQAVFHYLLRQPEARPHPSLLTDARFVLDLPQGERLPLVHDGGSIGLAAAVALYGAWTAKQPASDLLFTGSLALDGQIRSVCRIEDKVSCALRERPALRAIIVPLDNASQLASIKDPRIRPVQRLDELLQLVFDEAPAQLQPRAVDVDSSLRYGLQLYEQASAFAAAVEVFDQVATTLRALPDASRQRELFVAQWRGASCRLHLGQLAEAEDLFSSAAKLDEKLWADGELSPEHHFGFCGNRAVLLRDRLDFKQAEQLLLTTLSQQRQLRQDKRQLAKTLGNLGELLTFARRFDEAEHYLLEALDYLQKVYPDEVPRELYYLGNLCLMRGDALQATRRFEQGQTANAVVEHGGARNAAFLSYGLARARLALGEAEEAESIASTALLALAHVEPYPRQAILRIRGLCRWTNQRLAAERDLDAAADQTWARGPLMRFVVSIADAERAALLLDEGDWQQAAELACRFADNASGVIDHDWPRCLGEQVNALVAARSADELTALLRRCLSLLPY